MPPQEPIRSQPYLITIFDSNGLYEIRCRGTVLTSITHFADNSRMTKSLTWDELEKDVQNKVIEKVRKHLSGE